MGELAGGISLLDIGSFPLKQEKFPANLAENPALSVLDLPLGRTVNGRNRGPDTQHDPVATGP